MPQRRNELTALEQSEHLHRRKQVYEALHPATKQGQSQARGSNKKQGKGHVAEIVSATFSADTAKKAGITERSVRHGVQIAKDISHSRVVSSERPPHSDHRAQFRPLLLAQRGATCR